MKNRNNPYRQTFSWSECAQIVIAVIFAACLGALFALPLILKLEFIQAATQYFLTH